MRNQEHEPVYVVSVAARLAKLPSWVLRVLDQEGVVVPVRTESNRRLYSDHDIALLARVQYWMKERGVNIEGVKVILEMERERDGSASPAATPIASTAPVALSPFSETVTNSR
ncbi:MAG: MerR family transcriptional regulator [Cytophagales bacterium]|nr:MerR family transcriptional regulator [Armatimonadota bacterium]